MKYKIKKFIAWLFNIYTFEDFEKSIDTEPITFTQLSIIHRLQPRATFDYKNEIVFMNKKQFNNYGHLLTPVWKSNKHRFALLFWKGWRVVERK